MHTRRISPFGAGSPTQIAKASDKVRKGAGVKETNLDPSAAANYIVEKLTEKHVL